MADKITWANKESLVTDPTILEKNKVTDSNMNEIKSVVNDNADNLDELIVEGEENITENTKAVIKEGVIRHFTEISNTYGTSESIGYSQEYQNKHNVIVSADTPTTDERVHFKYSRNLFDKNSMLLNAFINQGTGQLASNNDFRTIYFKCKPNTTYTFYKNVTSNRYVVGYTSDTDLILPKTLTNIETTNTTFTTANNTQYVFIMISKVTDDTSNINDILNSIIINEGSSALPYEPYIEYKSIQVDNKPFTETVSVGTDENNSRVWFKKGINLVDKSTILKMTTINATTGLPESTSNFSFATQLIKVKPNTDYYVKAGPVVIYAYDTNKSFMSIIKNNAQAGTFNTGSAEYIRGRNWWANNTNEMNTQIDNAFIYEGTTDTTYEPYITPSINVDGETIYTKTDDDDEWELLTLTSEFKNYNNNISFRPKIKKEGNVVTIKGIISPTANITNTSTEHIMFVIPEKYRPTDMPLHQVCQASGMNKWLLIVAVDGNVTLSRYGTTEMTTAPASSWLPFTITYLL